ncbi:hypothetical protein [Nocardia ninae]|nr:hypothetical protein [Nocardia ninae]
MTMAAEDIARGSQFVDYIGLFVPAGVVTGALIAALVAWWNERRSPLDELESLIEIRKSWPASLSGVEAVDYEIGRQLAKLRIAANAAYLPSHRLKVDTGLAAVQEAWRRRRRTTRRLAFWLTIAVIGIGTNIFWSDRDPEEPLNERMIIAMLAGVVAGFTFTLTYEIWDRLRDKAARAEWRNDMKVLRDTLTNKDL